VTPSKPTKTFDGIPCVKCGNSERFVSNRKCVFCRHQPEYKQRQKQHNKEYRRKFTVLQRAKKAAYARQYRRTERGKEVNRVGQMHSYTKRLNVEGSHTTQDWIDLKNFYGNRCLRCGKHQSMLNRVLEEDHVIPLSKHGTNYITNIQPLCHDCNGMGGKGTATTDYRTSANR